MSEHRTIAPELSFIKDERDTMRTEEAMVISGIRMASEKCQKELEALQLDLDEPATPFPELGHFMINRRNFLTLATLSVLFPLSVRAQSAEKAAAFVKSTGDRLVAVVNGPGSISAKRAAMTQIINSDVDVEGIARFCLGRYWKQATPEQQKQYLALFHEVLVTNITAKLGEYQGVTFTMGRSRPQDEEAVVSTTVVRPNNPPTAAVEAGLEGMIAHDCPTG